MLSHLSPYSLLILNNIHPSSYASSMPHIMAQIFYEREENNPLESLSLIKILCPGGVLMPTSSFLGGNFQLKSKDDIFNNCSKTFHKLADSSSILIILHQLCPCLSLRSVVMYLDYLNIEKRKGRREGRRRIRCFR